MNFDLQPSLSNEWVTITPLKAGDFEELYSVASDPLIWEQHPNKDRYKREVFELFFEGAIKSAGAFLVTETTTQKVIGSSRYYNFDERKNTITVGYTFIGRNYWGKAYNKALKSLMFNHAFQQVNCVVLHLGATNFRSQKAIQKLGAKKVDELPIAYYGEPIKLNFVYEIQKQDWFEKNQP